MSWGRPSIHRSRNLPSLTILLFVVAFAPLPFGSTNDLSIACWCLCLSAALIFASTQFLRPQHLWLLCGIGIIVAGYIVVLHEQLSDQPFMAPFNPIWRDTGALLQVPIKPSASLVKNEAFFALGSPLANILALSLGIIIGAERESARRILMCVGISGALYALYGVLSFVIEPTMLLWRDKTAYLGSVTGTFINRNTAAIYFGLAGVVWVLLTLETIKAHIPRRRLIWRKLTLDLREIPASKILPPALALLVCLMAMFMTVSRAGVGISLIAMIVSAVVFLRKDLPAQIGLFAAFCCGLAIALGLLELLGEQVASRFDSQGLADEGRIEAWKSTLGIISDHPWIGTGIGTFAWAFPPWRSSSISTRGVWDAAHSTPLELASEVGVPLAILVSLGWMVMLIVLFKGAISRRRDIIIPLSAASAAGVMLLHSSLDFTLQIPGCSIPFFALFGAGLAQSFRVAEADSRSGRPIE